MTTHSGSADLRAALTGPSKVALGKPFRLALHVTNVGGQTGTLSTNVSVTEGKSLLSRSLEQTISPGETATVRTAPIRFDTADTYTFSVGISNISHTVTVRPKTGTFGTPFHLTDALQATVKTIAFHPAILYSPSASGQTFLQQAPSNSLLAVVRVSLENVGTQSATVGSGSFQVANGEVYRTLGSTTPLSAAQINGQPLTDLRLSPGEQRTGWILAQIPRAKARKTITAIYQRDSTGTPPEIQWTTTPKQGTRALPQFSVTNLSLPDTAMLGHDANASFAVSNEGNKTRTFRGMVQYRSGNSEDWRGFQPITARIRPGKSVRRNFTINSTSNGSVSYRLAPLKTTHTVKFVPPTFAFGKSYKTTENVTVTVSNLQTAKAVQTSSTGETYRHTPPSGERFVLARVEAVGGGESEGTPSSEEFILKSGSQTFARVTGLTHPLVAPVEGTPYGGVYDPDRGETYSWYEVWTVPQQIQLGNLTVVWTSSEDSTGAQGETARWTKGGKTSR